MLIDEHPRLHTQTTVSLASSTRVTSGESTSIGPIADTDPAEDLDAALARSRVLALMFDAQEALPHVGRYKLSRKLGEGGMGAVYLGHDAQLDREVAIKLLPAHRQTHDARERMLREAQGLARLSHPNVVQLYEVGEHERGLFLAMEFVDGQTLREHLQARAKDLGWRACLELLVQAGRGLAAAHAASLVHRDVKPDNILVGNDGRVRVADFGLVHGRRNFVDTEDSTNAETSPGRSASLLERSLTVRDSIVGTPAYMAPEQHRGESCDALVDQFAFCVVAWEALFGQRPFAGRDLTTLRDSVLDGKITIPSDSKGVPRSVRLVLGRGLAVEPNKRWANMNALLHALGRAAGVRRRRMLAALALAFVGAAATAAFVYDQDVCSIGESMLVGTWGDDEREQLRVAFANTGLSSAAQSAEAVADGIDVWSTRWLGAQTRACENARVTGTETQTRLDERTACLARKRREGEVVIDLLLRADRETVARSPELLSLLPSPSPCLDDDLVDARFPLPEDPQVRTEIEQAYDQLAELRALARMGALADAHARADALVQRAQGIGHVPLQIELQALAGQRALWSEDLDNGVPTLLDAAREAHRQGLDELAATLRTQAAQATVGVWGQPGLEASMLAEAEAAVGRIAGADDRRVLELSIVRGRVLDDAGRFEEALPIYRDVLARADQLGAIDLTKRARHHIGQTLGRLGRFDEAQVELTTAGKVAQEQWGPMSPSVAHVEQNLGLLAYSSGRPEDAAAHFDAARAIYVEVHGPGSPIVAEFDISMAALALATGDFERAEALYEQASAVGSSLAVKSRADIHEGLGAICFDRRDYHGAIVAYRQALGLRERVLAPGHPDIATAHANIAEAQVELGEIEAAEASFTNVIEVLEQALGPRHPDLAFPYKGRGQARLARGTFELARADLEWALALQPAEPTERADTEFSLARALAELGESSGARASAESARDRYRKLGDEDRAAAIDEWLARLR